MHDKKMVDEERLSELLLQWEESLQSGADTSAESLCRDYPHLMPRLKEKIRRLLAIQPMLATEDFGNHDTDTASPPQPAATPDSVATNSNFRFISHHATGGHGQIHVAWDTTLNREVAIKSVRPEYSTGSDGSQRLKREAEITGRLNHPGIVPVHSVGKDESGRPFYSMQLVHGETLRKSVAEFYSQGQGNNGLRRLKFLKLLRHFIGVCDTIAFAHSQNVVHRDIKPENILLGEYGETFVVDWGLAIIVGDSAGSIAKGTETDSENSESGRVMGTQGFMSPEQLCGKHVGKPSDIFNLGATLYTILTGKTPYRLRRFETDVTSLIAQIPSPRKMDRSISPALSSICMQAMAVEPDQRYAEVKDLSNDLQRWLADEPVSVYKESVTQRVMRFGRRHKYLAIAATSVLMVATIAFATSTLLINREKNKTLVANEVAQKNYQLAKSAVDDLFVEFSQNRLLEQPGTHSLRAELLMKSLEYYQQFIGEQGDDENLMSEIADANERVAFIINQIGSQEESIRHLDQAVVIRKQIYEANSEPENAVKLARALNRKSESLLGLGNLPEAADHVQLAQKLVKLARGTLEDPFHTDDLFVDILMQLAAVHFARGEYDQAIAINHEALLVCRGARIADNDFRIRDCPSLIQTNIGNCQRMRGDFDAALDSYRNAVEELDVLVEAHPEIAKYRASKANALNQIGSIEILRDDADAATAALAQSIKEFEVLTAVESDVHDFQRMLADAYTQLGRLLIPTDHERARRLLLSAADIRNELVTKNPDDIGFRFNSAAANCSLAKLDMASARFDAAIEYFGSAIEVFRQLDAQMPNDPQVRVRGLACTLQALGEAQHANRDYDDAILSRRESLDIYHRYHRVDGSLETERIVTQLSRELAESLLEMDQNSEALAVLRDRVGELSASPFVTGKSNAESRQLAVEIDNLLRMLRDYYPHQTQLANQTKELQAAVNDKENPAR